MNTQILYLRIKIKKIVYKIRNWKNRKKPKTYIY